MGAAGAELLTESISFIVNAFAAVEPRLAAGSGRVADVHYGDISVGVGATTRISGRH